MSINSEIQRILNNIQSAYTACDGKGATIPQTQNSANLATCISSISGGGSIDPFVNIPYNFMINTDLEVTPFGRAGTADRIGYKGFFHPSAISTQTEADDYPWVKATLSSNTLIIDNSSLQNKSFTTWTKFSTGENPKILILNGFTEIGQLKTNISSISTLEKVYMQNVTKIDLFERVFQNSALTEFEFTSLSDITYGHTFWGTASSGGTFSGCSLLENIYFPSLTSTSFGEYTNHFDYMLKNVTGCTVHFPSNLQSKIGSWSSVTGGFGGTNTTVLFDLTATT